MSRVHRHAKHPIHHAVRHHAVHHSAHTLFVQHAVKPAQQSEEATGVPASVTIAQAILESAWGAHHIGSANNYFGIKAQEHDGEVTFGSLATGYVDKKTKEHVGKKDVTITAHFRSYPNMQASFVDHGMFLSGNQRYRKALENYANTGDADEFARGLQKAGYATDPHYADLLISIMKHRNLYRYNKPPATSGAEGVLP
jgi:flagellum-specific peptidoglycan hydrolase FlgJ